VDGHARNSTSNSCARIIAAIRSTPPPSPSAAALKKQLLTHLVGVHNNHVAIIATTLTSSNMHESHEQAVALRPHPPVLPRPAFVRHAAGGNSCMQRQRLL
jgi:hypothetical protein